MDKALESLISAFKSLKKVDTHAPHLLDYIKTYAMPSKAPVNHERTRLRLQQRRAWPVFQSLSQTDLNYAYADFVMSIRLEQNFGFYIKALALGLQVPPQSHKLYPRIREWRSTYLALKSFKDFASPYHARFFDDIRKAVAEYEETIIRSDADPLVFFANLYPAYLRLNFLHQINSSFDVNLLFKEPFQDIGVKMKPVLNHSIREFIRGNHAQWELSCLEPETCTRIRVLAACLQMVREFAKFASTGDGRGTCPLLRSACPYAEKAKVDLRPRKEYITTEDKENIRTTNRPISAFTSDACEEQCACSRMCLLFNAELDALDVDNDLPATLDFLLRCVTVHLSPLMQCLSSILAFLKKIFLFSRSDFVQCMFSLLRDLPLTKHSFIFVLDSALEKTLRPCSFTKEIDIVLLDSQDQWNYFTLFLKMEYPIDILMSKEDRIELSQIFKHLWRMKKTENLLIAVRTKVLEKQDRIRVIAYLDLVFKLNFYVFYEVIEKEYTLFVEGDKLLGKKELTGDEFCEATERIDPLHGLKTRFKEFFATIHRKIFMEKEIRAKLIAFLDGIEKMCRDVAKSGTWDDDPLRADLKGFTENVDIDKKTFLHAYLAQLAL